MTLPGKAEAQHTHHAFYLGLLEDVGFNLLDDSAGSLLRRTGRQLNIDKKIALVFLRQKRRRQPCINHAHHGNDRGVDD